MTDEAPMPLAEQPTERVVTLKVNTSLLFDALKQMNGNCSPLGERLASVLLSTASLREMVGLLGVYGIEIEDNAATLQQHERAMAVVEAALRFCMLNGTKKAEAHKDLADAVMWFTPWKAALDDAASVAEK